LRLAVLAAAAALVGCAHLPDRGGLGSSADAGQPASAPPLAPARSPPPALAASPTAPEAAAGTGTPAPTPEPEPEITLALVGDVMLGSTFPEDAVLPPDEARGLLAEAAPVLAGADLAIGNLEGPMLEGGESEKCKRSRPGRCYAFRMPVRYAGRLREAGFAAMSLANNHAGDFGAEGRASTRRALDGAGIGHSGEPGDVARLEVRGRRLVLVAFATSDATHDLRDLAGARALVAALAAESDLVLVSFHGGAEGAGAQHVPHGPEEFYGEARGDLRAFARALVDAGAALVFGHGPHVVRGLEVYRGRLIAYSLGNFATWGSFNLSGPNALAPVLEVRLGADGVFRGGRVHAFRQEKPGGPRRDPSGEVIRRLRDLSREDFGASAVQVSEDGALSPPAQPPGS